MTVPIGFGLGPISRDVRLTGWVPGYSETTAEDDVALLAVVSHEGDVIVALGAHEPDLDEREALLALMERIEHEGSE